MARQRLVGDRDKANGDLREPFESHVRGPTGTLGDDGELKPSHAGKRSIRFKAVLRESWWMCGLADQAIVLGMRADPEPNIDVVDFNSQGTVP